MRGSAPRAWRGSEYGNAHGPSRDCSAQPDDRERFRRRAGSQWVEFTSATTPPTPLALKQAKARGVELKQEPGAPLRGLFVRPEGKGPFPTIILLHGCDGIQPFQEQWAVDLAKWGYVALLVDSHGPRGIGDDCPNWPPTADDRAFDAYGALRYLRGLPEVDAARIGVLGWDTGGTAAIRVLQVHGVQQFVPERFAVGIALYPIERFHPPVSAPALILIGGGCHRGRNPEWSGPHPACHPERSERS